MKIDLIVQWVYNPTFRELADFTMSHVTLSQFCKSHFTVYYDYKEIPHLTTQLRMCFYPTLPRYIIIVASICLLQMLLVQEHPRPSSYAHCKYTQ